MKRTILAVFSIFTALLLASCSGINTIEPDLEATVETYEENDTNSNKAYIKLSVDQNSSRTALPTIDSVEVFDSYNLLVKFGSTIVIDKTWTTNGSTSAYSQMVSETIGAPNLKTYDFILTAKLKGATFEGTARESLLRGVNNIRFTLALKELSEYPAPHQHGDIALIAPNSTLSIDLFLPLSVKACDAVIRTIDGTPASETPCSVPLYDVRETEHSELYPSPIYGFLYNFNMYPGTYIITFTFYGDTEKTLILGQWTEYAGIAGGLNSNSEIHIESEEELESVYSITLHPDSGNLTTTVPGSYTRFSSEIVLPTASQIQRTGYHFDGWFDAETGGNRIETIPAGSVGNKSLYARWSIIDYTITVEYNSRWGIVEIPATANYGEVVSFSFEPQIGCKFNSLSTEDVTLIGSGSARSFTMPASNVTITADFSKTHLGTKDSPDAVWDIVFNDGTATPYTSSLVLTEEQKAAAVAILYYHYHNDLNEKEYILGLGLKHTVTPFCSRSATCYGQRGDLSPHDGLYNTFMISHYLDDYTEENYPSVWWAKHYNGSGNLGNVAGDINGGYNFNWFIPSLVELRNIYDLRDTISSIIDLIGSPYADPLTTDVSISYGTSTQSDEADDSIVLKSFYSGNEVSYRKDYHVNQLVIRCFTPVNGFSD